MSSYYLIGDIGGTKTDLAAYSSSSDCRKYEIFERFITAEFDSPGQLIKNFINNFHLDIKKGVIAVAGPVLNDKVTKTSSNLPWEIDRLELINELGIPDLLLINDLEAVARAVPILGKDEFYTLNKGIEKKNGTLAIIAPGTGLGEAFMIWDGKKYKSCISEGAHVNFGPRNVTETELLNFIANSHGHVTYELICSGIGIPNIYEFLKEKKGIQEPDWLSDLMKQTDNKTQVIIHSAMENERPNKLVVETIKLFVSVLGAETGNLVLKTMASGGVFLAGGIPGKILTFLDSKDFLKAYSDKGIMTEMMLDVPIQVITNSKTAILGAADYLFQKISEKSSNEV